MQAISGVEDRAGGGVGEGPFELNPIELPDAVLVESAAEWERTAKDPQARALSELAEQQAMSEAIRSSGQSW